MTGILLRRGTAAAWTAADPVLGEGEPGFETDTSLLKLGDGSTAWTSLPYFAAGSLPDPTGEPDGEVLTTATGAAVWAAPAGGAPSGSAGGVLSGTYPNPGFAADMATQAELDAVAAASQPLDSDLTALAGLDSSTSGAIASDGAGWIKKTYAQFKTALGLSTADVPDSTNKRYVTDAQLTVIGNTSGSNSGDQTTVSGNAGTASTLQTARNIDGQAFDGSADITVIAPGTHAAASKATPVDADELPLADSAASFVLKKLTWANLKATLKTYFDTLYATGSGSSSGTNTGDQVAATVPFTPTGTISSTDVQAAVAEVASEASAAPAGFFGDGSDGPLSLTQASSAPAWAAKTGSGATTTFTLSRDVYATTFDLDDSGGNFLVNTGHYRIFASTSLTIDSGVTVHNDGVAASGTAGGVNATAQVFGIGVQGSSGVAGGTGGAAGTATSSAAVHADGVSVTHGGGGGAATGGGTGGGGVGGAAQLTVPNGSPSNIVQIVSGRTLGAAAFAGGGAGRAGNAAASSTGGGGGAGGNIIGIYAAVLVNNGTIRAQGGHGGNASGTTNAGGGGGGGGGAVLLVYGAAGSTLGTVTAPGGIGGNPVGTGAIGGTGQTGLVWSIVV